MTTDGADDAALIAAIDAYVREGWRSDVRPLTAAEVWLLIDPRLDIPTISRWTGIPAIRLNHEIQRMRQRGVPVPRRGYRHPPRGPRPKHVERNQAIRQSLASGRTIDEVAAAFGLSPTRVRDFTEGL